MDIFNLNYYKNNDTKGINVVYDDQVIASFSYEPYNVDVNHDIISSFRSKKMQIEAYKAIIIAIDESSEYSRYSRENMTISAIDCVFRTFNISDCDKKLIKDKDQKIIVDSINALSYSYNNIWYSSRVSMGLRLRDLFVNNSDEENDIIAAIFLINDVSNVEHILNCTNFMPLVRLKDDHEQWTRKALKCAKYIKQDYYDEEAMVRGEYFKSVDEVIAYYNKYN